MQDVVIIPTYDRPEMLWLCLEYLSRSPDSLGVTIKVYVDAHLSQPPPSRIEIEEVISKFPKLTMQVIFRSQHRFHGNSFNVLMAYKEAFGSTARYVFMVEDDVLIRPEFFAWHRLQHTNRKIECSVGVGRRPEHAHYASLGVCFRREVIAKVLSHCQMAYFHDMRGYCRHAFPSSKFDCEQDGLWCRVLPVQSVVWPRIPVAQHVGWYGYHRKRSRRPTGTLAERYEQVKQVLTNGSMLKAWTKEFHDVSPLMNFGNQLPEAR